MEMSSFFSIPKCVTRRFSLLTSAPAHILDDVLEAVFTLFETEKGTNDWNKKEL